MTTGARKSTGSGTSGESEDAATPVTRPARSVSGRSAFQPLYSRAPAETACRARMSSKSCRLRDSPKSG